MKRVLICFGCVLLAGCAAEEPGGMTLDTSPSMMFTTRVTSKPSGARIELDDEFVGETPLDIEWKVYSAKANLFFKDDHVLRALPTGLGQYAQKKSYSSGAVVPKTISFDMKK